MLRKAGKHSSGDAHSLSAANMLQNTDRTAHVTPLGCHRTVIVVAHKLQSIKNADTICVIEAGKLVESGNHEQLVQRKSRYYELVKSQL